MYQGRLATAAALALAAVACICAGPAVAAEPLELDAGALTVRVQPEPFQVEFVDVADGDVLRTLAGAPGEPGDLHARYGTLGFSFDLRMPIFNNAVFGVYRALEVETVWFHATRLLSAERTEDGLTLEAATDDPLGHRLAIDVERTGDGIAAVESRVTGPLAEHASVSGSAFEAVGSERYLGFGERSNAVDQTGNHVFNWSEEGPFSSGVAEPLLRPLVPEFTFPSGPTATNFPIPWLVSTRGFGVLLDQPERSAFNLRNHTDRAWQAQAESSRFRFEVYAGPDPADVLRRYSEKVGRQPEPASWMLGPWVQFGDGWEERFREQDVPASVAQTYTHYLPCGSQVGNEQRERDRVARYHGLGYRITTYFNPHVCREYTRVHDEAERRGLLVKDPSGEPYLLSNPFTADKLISEIDFSHPEAGAFYGGLLDEAIEHGYDGWMEDFGEYTPTNAVFANGERGTQMHNPYPVLYHCASTEHTGERAPAVFIRSGWHGVQPCARAVWGGDPTEDWSCSDGLCAAVHQALSMGLSGIAWWGTDIGGFHAVVNPRTDAELQIRWLQFGAVNGIMRTQQDGYALPGLEGDRAEVWDPAVLPVFRRWAKLRTQLQPYIAAAGEAYQRSGLPVSRHLALAFPDDPQAVRSQTELLFGRDLLAAPVVEPGARSRAFHLPSGPWVDLWRSAGYDETSGGLELGAAELLPGGGRVSLPAPLAEMPLLVRAGAVIPMLPPDVDTLSGVGDLAGLVQASDRADNMRLLAFPRGARRAGMGNGEHLASREHARGGRWTLRVGGKRERSYELQASLATLKGPFEPCTVTLGGQPLPFDWDAATQVLRATFTTRRGTLDVRACGG
ncbi:MAG: TIM-barrel domain-containing protein [Thermoleophilaceae bacterium]